jgi:tetratricopeptide (TPR) repeat protein
MDCDRIERDGMIESYLHGKLDKAEQKTFEEHYFGCSECREKLQVARMLQLELWEKGSAVLPQAKKARLFGIRSWAMASAAAVFLILVAAALWWLLRTPDISPVQAGKTPTSLSLLARLEPPPYIAPALRGTEDEAAERFRAGMKRYQEGEYAGAIPELRDAAGLKSDSAQIRFFLGICFLLSGRLNEGIEELKVAESLGDPDYLEESRFFLAKAFLGKADIGAASEKLRQVVESNGRMKDEAAGLLRQLK